MKTVYAMFIFFGSILVNLEAQISINNDGTTPNPGAMLDIASTNRGILLPRVSEVERNAIPSPATGLLVYNSTSNLLNFFNGSFWCSIPSTFISGTTGSIRPGGGVSINIIPGTPPDSSAMLDITSSVRGILVPRTDPVSIPAPATGLIVYNSSTNHLSYYNGTNWLEVSTVLTSQAGAAGSQAAAGFAIKTDGTEAHPSAMLDISAPDKGLLIPRMTDAQRNGISPVTGLIIYNTTSNMIEFYNGTSWYRLNVGFSCGQPLVDSRDGHVYNTTQIGTQCWMAQSLNYGLMIPNNTQMANNGVAEKWCFDNDEMLCQEYGALYQWDEAMQYSLVESTQGLCPVAWHIPSEAEWVILDDFLGGYYNSGGPMKETGTVHWASPNSGATNTSGFTGIGAGFNDYTNATPSSSKRYYNYIWSSTQYGAQYARRRLLLYFNARSNPYYDFKWIGFSVRCVKD